MMNNLPPGDSSHRGLPSTTVSSPLSSPGTEVQRGDASSATDVKVAKAASFITSSATTPASELSRGAEPLEAKSRDEVMKKAAEAVQTSFNLSDISKNVERTEQTRADIVNKAEYISKKLPICVNGWNLSSNSGSLYLEKGKVIYSVSFKSEKEHRQDQRHIPPHEVRIADGKQGKALIKLPDLERFLTEVIGPIYEELTKQRSQ